MELVLDALPVLVNFLAVVLVLYFSTRKASAAFLLNRTETIATSIAEAEKASLEASKLLNEWETKWKASEAHSKQMMDEAKVTLERLRVQGLEKSKHEADRIAREAKLVAETESLRIQRQLQSEIVERSLVLTQNYLTKHLTEDDRKKLVSEYVEIVGNGIGG